MGLFGRCYGTQFKNLGVETAVGKSIFGYRDIGCLVGCLEQGVMTNCYANGAVEGTSTIGLLAGSCFGQISNCFAEGTVIGGGGAGGLFGAGGGNITDCYFIGTIESDAWVGGLVGSSYNAAISRCYSIATVTGRVHVGGLIGINKSGTSISNSFSVGKVVGIPSTSAWGTSESEKLGGLVGTNEENSTISNCFTLCSVSGYDNVGGLVGYLDTGTVGSCYAAGAVSASNSNSGGLIGYRAGGEISGCYYDETVTGQVKAIGFNSGSIYGFAGMPTLDMKKQDTFSGWNFNEIWLMDADGYPRLQWAKDIDLGGGGGDEPDAPKLPLGAWIGIACGAAVLIGGGVFVIVRRKKIKE